MIIRQKIIARKYAQAFLNLYFDALTQLHIDAVIDLHKFLLENKGILCYLSLPGLTEQAWTDFTIYSGKLMGHHAKTIKKGTKHNNKITKRK